MTHENVCCIHISNIATSAVEARRIWITKGEKLFPVPFKSIFNVVDYIINDVEYIDDDVEYINNVVE